MPPATARSRHAGFAAVAAVLLALLVTAQGLAAPAVGPMGSSAPDLAGLVFSPEGGHIAILVAGRETSGSEAQRLYVVSARDPGAGPILVGRCATRSASWLAAPERLVYGVMEDGRARLVARGMVGPEVESPASAAKAMGAVGARDDLAVTVVERPAGGFELWQWDVGRGDLSRWTMPATFTPSLTSPPVLSAEHGLVAVVDDDGSYFVGLRPASGVWLKPAKKLMRGETWEWLPVGSADLSKGSWLTGGWSVHDRFIVDDTSLTLWDAVTLAPAGPCVREGDALVMPGSVDLVPLDLDNARYRLPSLSHRVVALAADEIGAVTATTDLKRTALIWEGGYCVRHDAGGVQQGVVKDRSVAPAVLSISSDGRMIALGRHGRQIDLVDAGGGRVQGTWQLSQFTMGVADLP